jgi:hypothetical protein
MAAADILDATPKPRDMASCAVFVMPLWKPCLGMSLRQKDKYILVMLSYYPQGVRRPQSRRAA